MFTSLFTNRQPVLTGVTFYAYICGVMDNPLKTWRTTQNLSQGEAGERLGVDAMTISRWERGEHLPRKKHWRKIEEMTGIAPSDLLALLKVGEPAQ